MMSLVRVHATSYSHTESFNRSIQSFNLPLLELLTHTTAPYMEDAICRILLTGHAHYILVVIGTPSPTVLTADVLLHLPNGYMHNMNLKMMSCVASTVGLIMIKVPA